MDIRKFSPDTPEDELIRACYQVENASATSEGKAWLLEYLLSCLNIRQQKKLLEAQNKFNKELLKDNKKLIETNKKLVKATWTLAIATIVLAVATIILVLVI